MPGTHARRNAGHKTEHAARYAAARDDAARLAAALDWFRASAALLARRRPPRGAAPSANREASVRLTREVTAYLKNLAQTIDGGSYDANTE